MYRNKYLFLSLIALWGTLCITACNNATLKKMGIGQAEADHFPRKKMGELLLDLNLAEAYSTMTHDTLFTVGQKHTDSLSRYYQAVFAHHHITKEQFDASMAWYKAHPEEMDSVINDMIPILARWQNTPLPKWDSTRMER